MTERKQQLAEQLLYKAKEMELLISILPSTSDLRSGKSDQDNQAINGAASSEDGVGLNTEDNDTELQELEREMLVVNEEYLEVLNEAGMCMQCRRSTLQNEC